ncbi:MAG: phage tail tape measure protein [Pseudomonadota bacterium]
MEDHYEEVERFGDAVGDLDNQLQSSSDQARRFKDGLGGVSTGLAAAQTALSGMESSLSGDLKSAMTDLVWEGGKLSDVFTNLAKSMVMTTFDKAIDPVAGGLAGTITDGLTSIIGGILPFAKGGVIADGRVQAFAKGGVVSQPTTFPMARGTGLMGEAGPEAIMPLARGADGRLGVQAQDQKPIQVVMNINTPDAASFQKSRSQIAASMSRALSSGRRNM